MPNSQEGSEGIGQRAEVIKDEFNKEAFPFPARRSSRL